ncbi:hypothetical protein GGI22_002097 [Coemansia erecta]|nr:hypothetical protein GGI22_002097 [Coemansia erecta]
MCPFTSLRDHVDSIDLSALDPTDIAHVPYIVLIVKALQKFAAGDDDSDGWANYPQRLTRNEKKELCNVIRRLAVIKPDEENFGEATKSVMPQCMPYEVPNEIKQILNDPAAATVADFSTAATECKSNLTQQINHRFWLLANALRRYMASDYAGGKLPLSGTIPDMKADTKGYIALQKVYKNKADQDKSEFVKHMAHVLEEAHLPADYFTQEEIDVFCKNANKLRLRRTSAVHDEYASGPENLSMLEMNGVLNHYVLFRASAEFFAKYSRFPGAPALNSNDGKESLVVGDLNQLVESDTTKLSGIANELLARWKGDNASESTTIPVNMVTEFARSGFSELHNIASVSGGVIAQEAIKLITHQYVPGNNTFVFDGILGRLLTAKV